MSKHTAPATRRALKAEQAPARPPRPGRHAAPVAAARTSSIEYVGGNFEPATDTGWFGLPWLRSGRD